MGCMAFRLAVSLKEMHDQTRYKQHTKSLMIKLAKEVHWRPTITIKSGNSNLFAAWVMPLSLMMVWKTLGMCVFICETVVAQ